MSGASSDAAVDAALGGAEARARLEAFLSRTFPAFDGPLAIARTAGGMSNPTFFINAGDWSAVLRKQPGSVLQKSAHAIDREFRVLTALAGSQVPAPKPILYHAAADILDTPFYLMERLEGRVFDAYALPGLTPAERRACYVSMARVMAAMHRFDWAAAGLADYGRPGNFFARQFGRWVQLWGQYSTGDNPALDRLITWLEPRIPSSETLTICHGDYRIANVIFHPAEPRIVGVLDWELSTLGHPLADVGFNTQAWLLAPDENGGLRGLDLAALGIPTEAEYLETYYAFARSAERLATFHRVFAMFRAAVGSAGIAARGRGGNAVNAGDAERGARLSIAYAARGLELIDQES
jgi:aminoglycoside phosphotransferase (APT) family kinase protein